MELQEFNETFQDSQHPMKTLHQLMASKPGSPMFHCNCNENDTTTSTLEPSNLS